MRGDREGLGADLTKPLRRVLAFPGSLTGDVPAGDAPHADHVTSALRALATARRGRVNISGGRPGRTWAIVWALEEEQALLAEPEVQATAASPEESWREPLTLDGADAAARKLMRRIEDAVENADDEPLFIEFLDP